ncbi:MAG: RNA methyltransferase [Thermodesulfobacteriota bacterium]
MNQTSSKRIQRGFVVHSDHADALGRIQFVLVGVTHPGNVGAIARVMKNMGLSRLVLVSCVDSGPETEAFANASGAYDIVQRALITDDLSGALGTSLMAAGTSGRLGGKRVTGLAPRELVPVMLDRAKTGVVSCVFGRESRGLTNEEMKLCSHHMIVPTHADFASMNVAHAAAVVGYELFTLACRPVGFQARRSQPAAVASLEDMFAHIEHVLTRAGFLRPDNPLRMMRDIRRILNRADMDERDVKIVRGIFRKMDNMVRLATGEIRPGYRKQRGTRAEEGPDAAV